MSGGDPGKRGLNLLLKPDGRVIYLGAKTAVQVHGGDIFSMLTPGGGGYGRLGEIDGDAVEKSLGERAAGDRAFVEKGSVYEYRKAQESV